MRNFEEIKAEVFRRSENRIHKRKKKRNRILACCIPLCLCMVILAVVYMPQFNFINDKNNYIEYDNEICIEDLDGASQFAYTSLEITNDTASSVSSRKENDVEKVEKIYNTIQSCFAIIYGDAQNDEDIANGGSDTKGENYSSVAGLLDTNKKISYSIKFVTDDGTQTSYTLDGNILTNKTTEQSVTLTDSQLSELEMALWY